MTVLSKAESARVKTLHADTVYLGGTAVTATAAELNALDGATATAAEINKVAGVTAGTATAGKALVTHGTTNSVTGLRRPVLTKNADYTLTAADSGSLVIVTAADKVLTLPATAAGLWYTVVLAAAGLSAGTGLSISPNASDQIAGNGFTLADNKDAILTAATDRAGDSITLVADGTDGWYIVAVTGTWAREG